MSTATIRIFLAKGDPKRLRTLSCRIGPAKLSLAHAASLKMFWQERNPEDPECIY